MLYFKYLMCLIHCWRKSCSFLVSEKKTDHLNRCEGVVAEKQLSKQETGRKCLSVDESEGRVKGKSEGKMVPLPCVSSILYFIHFLPNFPSLKVLWFLENVFFFVSLMPEKSFFTDSLSFFPSFTDYCFLMTLKALVLSFSSADLNPSNCLLSLSSFHWFSIFLRDVHCPDIV